jgi:serine protease Do
MNRSWPVLICGSCAFAGGIAGTLLLPRLVPTGAVYAQSPTAAAPGPVTAATTTAPPLPALSSGNPLLILSERFEQVARRVSPAVVAIEAVKTTQPPAGSTAKPRTVEESGSGVMIALEGGRGALVITNNHVVAEARVEAITVSLADGRLLRPTQVWADPESDVALLRLDTAERLVTASLGDSDKVRVGQWVLAIGSPFGLNQSVTHGIISARERGQVSLGNTIRIKDFLQTDAAINPGSSGGPLVNLDGEVIGINTAIASQTGSNSGVAFSIPINMVRRIARQLLETGSVSRGYLGVQLAQVLEPADALRLGLDRAQGALVEAVYPDTPAAAAGLKANDVVLQIDDQSIRNENHLINLVSTLPAGRKVRMRVWRNRQTVDVEATVGDWARAQARFRAGP